MRLRVKLIEKHVKMRVVIMKEKLQHLLLPGLPGTQPFKETQMPWILLGILHVQRVEEHGKRRLEMINIEVNEDVNDLILADLVLLVVLLRMPAW